MKRIIDTINNLDIKNYELYGDYMSKIDIDYTNKKGAKWHLVFNTP